MSNRYAFSLVELSIVLVILGLLTGAILAGQALIRASEIRSVGTDFSKYETAIYAFRDKYFALPGDMTNATAIWGKDATNCNGNTGIAATPGTCNGDGNGYVNQASPEMWRTWQHLSLAGLIEGSYVGTQTGWGTNVQPGIDLPAGRIPSSVYYFRVENNTNSEFAWVDLTYTKNMLIVANNSSTVLTPTEAWNVDTKWDDGAPGTGKVWGGNTTGGCVTSTTSTAAQYTKSGSNSITLRCVMGRLLS